MIDINQIDNVAGADVRGPNDDKIGSAGRVYVDDATGEPSWVTVSTGFFGTRESFIPLSQATWDGTSLRVPYEKSFVKDAPNADVDGHLSVEEEQQLYTYYGVDGGNYWSDTTTTTDTTTRTGNTAGTEGYDTSGPTTDNAMTRSEERLEVGTQRQEAGRARLRKYVVTEQQTVSVPVSREEVRLEREPITDANRGDALAGPAISEEEHEVVLHEERPVVTTTVEPVERVRMGTETVTETETVTGEVRKEQIEVDGGTTTTGNTTYIDTDGDRRV